MRRLFLTLGLAATALACDDDGHTHASADGGTTDARIDARAPDGGAPDGRVPDGSVPDGNVPDGSVPTFAACLDRPEAVARPTTGLPCALLPPGFMR